MIELHIGFISNQELADWFNIKLKSFINTKKKKIKELEAYAEFTTLRGGVEITSLKIEPAIYTKASDLKKQMIKEDFLDLWIDNDNALNTCSNVARKMQQKYQKDLDMTEESLTRLVRAQRTEYFGKPFVSDGTLGSCRLLWTKAVPISANDKIYVCVKLTPAEEKIKNDLLMKYYSTKNGGDVEKKMFIKDMVDKGIVTVEEGYEALLEADHLNDITWKKFLLDFKTQIGGNLMKTTELCIGKYFHQSEGKLKLLETEGNKIEKD